ncbi:MAG: hypothetical protein DMF67_02945 [Acidobacteria bacterium]|nr:MAG: hypothetical protein DMF67_02945 [Acidobacteriota bacterium]
MALDPGALDAAGNFINPDSMAKYIEDALPPPSPPPADPSDPAFFAAEKRKFLIGLSTGIINYLKAHDADSFQITIAPTGSGITAGLEIT